MNANTCEGKANIARLFDSVVQFVRNSTANVIAQHLASITCSDMSPTDRAAELRARVGCEGDGEMAAVAVSAAAAAATGGGEGLGSGLGDGTGAGTGAGEEAGGGTCEGTAGEVPAIATRTS